MLTLEVAGILGLDEIRDVGWVLLWFGCTFNPSRILPLSAYADVALPGAGLFLCGSASISLLSSSDQFAGIAAAFPKQILLYNPE